jgi:hypothetical protein
MSTLLPIDALATPRRLVLDPPMTDAELLVFCQQNDFARIERTREGVIEMNPLAGSYSGDGIRRSAISFAPGGSSMEAAGSMIPTPAFICPTARCLAPMLLTSRLRGWPR